MSKVEFIEHEEKELPDNFDTGFEIEYYEYDCGSPCTVDGCLGHTTDQPVGFYLDGIWFFVEGYDGNFPTGNSRYNKQVKKVINKIHGFVEQKSICDSCFLYSEDQEKKE